MAALAPIPARMLKQMLEADGYAVKHEDDDNWIMDRGPDDETLSIPKYCDPGHGNVMALEVMDRYADDASRAVAHLDQAAVGEGLAAFPHAYTRWALEAFLDPRVTAAPLTAHG